MNIHWLTILGIILIGLGTLLTLLGQQEIFNRSNKQLSEQTDKIAELSKDNIELSKEISKLNKKFTADLTGGDSYCYLSPIRSTKFLSLQLIHVGKYPLYDIDIRIFDTTKLENIEKKRNFKNKPLELYKRYPVGNLMPGRTLFLDPLPLSTSIRNQKYAIDINARNGYVSQKIYARYEENKWYLAYKVERDKEVIKKYIDVTFPMQMGENILDW